MTESQNHDRSFIVVVVLNVIAAVLAFICVVAAIKYVASLDRKAKLWLIVAALICSLLGYLVMLSQD